MGANVKFNLHQRIHEVMKEVEYLVKDAVIPVKRKDPQTGRQVTVGSIPGLTHDGVMANIRTVALKHGVLIWPTSTGDTMEKRQAGQKTVYEAEVRISVDVMSVDNPDEKLTCEFSGAAMSWQSGSIAYEAAYSFAFKTMLLKTFMLPSGTEHENPFPTFDEPEDAPETTAEEPEAKAEPTNKLASADGPKVKATTLKELNAKSKQSGFDEKLLAVAKNRYGIEELKGLSEAQAQQLIGGMNTAIAEKAGAVA